MEKIEEILLAFKEGGKSMQEVLEYLEKLPFEDLCFAKVDHHREQIRRPFGAPFAQDDSLEVLQFFWAGSIIK